MKQAIFSFLFTSITFSAQASVYGFDMAAAQRVGDSKFSSCRQPSREADRQLNRLAKGTQYLLDCACGVEWSDTRPDTVQAMIEAGCRL